MSPPSQKVSLPPALSSKPKSLVVTSPDLREGERIATELTCQGADVSPTLRVLGAPRGTQALALIMDDPDAPGGTFTHWVAWNLPASTVELPRGVDVARLGGATLENDMGNRGYNGPCPPAGEEHRYFFRVFALDRPLDVPADVSLDRLWREVATHAVAWGELMGRYKKS